MLCFHCQKRFYSYRMESNFLAVRVLVKMFLCTRKCRGSHELVFAVKAAGNLSSVFIAHALMMMAVI